MEYAEIIATTLSTLAFLAVLYSLHLTRKGQKDTREGLEETKKSVEIATEALEIFKKDIEAKFSQFRFNQLDFEHYPKFIPRGEDLIIEVHFFNDSAFVNYAERLILEPDTKEELPKSAMICFPSSHQDTRVPAGENKIVEYRAELKVYRDIFDKERAKITFYDRLNHCYEIRNYNDTMM